MGMLRLLLVLVLSALAGASLCAAADAFYALALEPNETARGI
jgi:ABC-type Fe3+-siderophore transport system permease subunit